MSEPPSTRSELLTLYQSPVVPIEDICLKYLGMSWAVARSQAAANTLPFPTFRVSDSRKSQLVVTVGDLAAHIDRQRDAAHKLWAAAHAAA